MYLLIQWTWGIVQNVLAASLFVGLCSVKRDRNVFFYHGAIVIRWNHPYSMGLGMFIFLGIHSNSQKYNDMVLVHEYGHTIQSCILGPLFLLVISIPSLLWASIPYFDSFRSSKKVRYTDFYPEHWASYLGEKILKLPADWN